MFQHLTQLSNSGNEALQMCFDLSLAEFDESLSMCYLHPYIQEHIQDTVIDNESELRHLNAIFVVTYFEKLLGIADEQMEKDSFVDVVGMLALDSHNNEKFISLLSTQNQPQTNIFKKSARNKQNLENCVSLVNSLWFLDKIGRYKSALPVLATELEQIFHNSKMKAYEILCKCFLSHKLRLLNGLGNIEKSRLKIEEADKINNFSSSSQSVKFFCDGQVRYAMGRFTQMTKIIKHWQKDFDWEHTSTLLQLLIILIQLDLLQPKKFFFLQKQLWT